MYKLRTSNAGVMVNTSGNNFKVLQLRCKCGELYTFLSTSVYKETCRACKSRLPLLFAMGKEDLIKLHKDSML